MLPSNNFFRDILCPYDKAKLCHRPYCHYRHTETDTGQKSDEIEVTEYLFDAKPSTASYETALPAYVQSIQPLSKSCYVPTPVTKQPGILKTSTSNIDRKPAGVPVYNPTPISKLKELNTLYDCNAPYVPFTKKKKKIEEYDPTEVKYVSKKTVMFADQAGADLDDGFTPAFSSNDEEEEDEDPENAPQFSDDDVYENNNKSSKLVHGKKTEVVEDKEDEEEEKNIDQFSVVDKILVDSRKTEKLLTRFRKPLKVVKLQPKLKAKSESSTEVKKSSETSDVYDCDMDFGAIPIDNSFDLGMIPVDYDNLMEDKLPNSVKETTPKSFDNLLNSSKSGIPSKEGKDALHSSKSSSSSSSKKSKGESSKDSAKKTSLKTKHSKHSSTGEKEKSDSSSKVSKLDKAKTHSSKSEKSTADHKGSKSDKSKSSSSSDKNKKSCSNSDKIKSSGSSSQKSKSSSSGHDQSKGEETTTLQIKDRTEKKSDSTRQKEAKLQDEKVSSSSIMKKSKSEQTLKHSSKSSDSHSSSKSKHSSKDDKGKSKSSKRKAADEPDSEKDVPKKKSTHSSLSSDDDDGANQGFDDDVISISSDDPEEECKRIFEETFVPDNECSVVKEPSETKSSIRDLTVIQKKRLAHAGTTSLKKTKQAAIIPRPVPNPGKAMVERFARIRAAAAQRDMQKEGISLTGRPGEKKRISLHANNPSLLAAIMEKNRREGFTPLLSTVSKTLKVTKRIAHVPDVATKPRPVIPVCYGSKVPTNVRQKFLDAFIEEYLKFSPSEDEAYDNALEEENKAYQRSSSKAIYMNVASNTLNRLRHQVSQAEEPGKKPNVTSTTNPSVKTVSHEAVLNGPQAQRTSFSIERKKTATTVELKGVPLYEHLMTYLLNEEQLNENGYPFPHSTEPGKAVISGIYANKIKYCNDPFKRTCCRCQKVYFVNVDGDYVCDEECDFHWGRLFKRRIAGAIESRYTCCQGDSESDGCCVGIGHVFEGSESHALKGYVNTLPKSPPRDRYYGIYALDCEMCYTTAGVELTRISVVGPDLQPVYESFVKPQNKVLDYNTRFSGITEENLRNVRTTISDVQAVLLCMFSSKTILIGHSLESDFKALKLFHHTVVDTSVVFPHKLGPPYKRALRNLTAEKLNKIIQNDVGGHDSAEDAVSCMQLMNWKIKEDLKANR